MPEIKFHAFERVYIVVDHSPVRIMEGIIKAPHPSNDYKSELTHLLKWYVEFPAEWYSGYYYQESIHHSMEELLEDMKGRVIPYDTDSRRTV